MMKYDAHHVSADVFLAKQLVLYSKKNIQSVATRWQQRATAEEYVDFMFH